jgi:hypothetical protein
MISEEGGGPFRVIRWRPGIRGTQRSFQLRTMTRDGRLWFACQDVQKALGWTKRELLRRRSERLDGSTWGTTTAQWEGRGPRLAFISLTGLQVVMAGSVARHNRAFAHWLEGRELTREGWMPVTNPSLLNGDREWHREWPFRVCGPLASG